MRTSGPSDERSFESVSAESESPMPKLNGAATRQPKQAARRASGDWDAERRVPARPAGRMGKGRGTRRGANMLARAVVVERPARPSVHPGSVGFSLGLHAALLLAFLMNPASPLKTLTAPETEPIPVEISFVPVPVAPQRPVAPPEPKRAERPVPAPAAPERVAQPERAAAPTTMRQAPPKPASLERPRKAETPRQRAVEPPKHAQPDLQAMLNARMSEGKTQEATSLAKLSDRARAGAPDAPDRSSATGAPLGAPTTSRSGLDGALASRAPLRTVKPDYPDAAMRIGEEGAVRLRIYVAPSGVVSQVEVLASSGRSYFDRAAIAAMSQWRFTPLEGAGQQYGDITLTFSLR